MKLKHLTTLGLLAFTSTLAQAGTNGFIVPTFRGQSGALFSGWERFTVSTDNGVGNSPDLACSAAPATLIQLDPNAIITGTGNIYNQTALSLFEIRDTSPATLDKLVLQIRTAGTELDYSSLKLTINAQVVPTPTRTELDRVAFGVPNTPGSGSFVSSLWTWDLAGLGTGPGTYRITFGAADPSLSFDSATLDTIPSVPEPGTFALMGVGVAALAVSRFRRR